MFSATWRIFLLLMIAFFVAGCGNSGPTLYSVKGTVKHKGKPIEHLMIVFTPDDQATKAPSTGMTDKNGRFEMKVNYDNPGVFPGPHSITAMDPLAAVGSKTSTVPEYLAVVAKYGNSPIKMTIEKNESNLELNLD